MLHMVSPEMTLFLGGYLIFLNVLFKLFEEMTTMI